MKHKPFLDPFTLFTYHVLRPFPFKHRKRKAGQVVLLLSEIKAKETAKERFSEALQIKEVEVENTSSVSVFFYLSPSRGVITNCRNLSTRKIVGND
jgi:hypothetical protein